MLKRASEVFGAIAPGVRDVALKPPRRATDRAGDRRESRRGPARAPRHTRLG